ncbi:MAG: FtsX-like permease family protein [Nitrospiraceae bacterium]
MTWSGIAARLRALLTLSAANAAAHPVRACLTAIGVALGVAAPIAIDAANRDVLAGFTQGVLQVAGQATLEVSAGETGLDERLIHTVRRHPDVLFALPVLQRTVRDVRSGQPLTILGTDLLDVAAVKPVRWRDASSDRTTSDTSAAPSASESQLLSARLTDGLFIGRRLAEQWTVDVGAVREIDSLSGTQRLTVGGIFESDGPSGGLWDSLAVMDIAAAQERFESIGRVDRIDIVTRPSVSVREVQQALESALPPHVRVRRPLQRGEQMDALVAAFRLNLVMLSAVGLMVGSFLIFNTLSFSVVQRRREIGILRAIGVSERGIRGLFLLEGVGYGVVGGLVGAVCGVALAEALVGLVGKTIGELYAAVGEGAPQRWDVGRVAWIAAQGAALGVAVSIVGALTPSREASRVEVVSALAPGGHETTTVYRTARAWWTAALLLVASAVLASLPSVTRAPIFGYLSVLALLLGLSASAPAWLGWLGRGRTDSARPLSLAGLAARSAARAPRRNGVAVSSVLVGVTILVGVLIMIHSFRQTVELWVEQTVMAELIVTPEGWLRGDVESRVQRLLPRAVAERLASVSGVEAVDTYRQAPIELGGRSRALVARDLTMHAERSRYLFVRGESRSILLRAVAEKGAIVSEVLATELGVREGDVLSIRTPSGVKPVPIAGLFYDYATDGGKVVVDRALYEAWWAEKDLTVIPLYLAASADLETVRAAVHQAVREMGTAGRPVDVVSNRELRREILAIFDRTFRMTYVLEVIALVIAMFGMVNTLLTAALERRRELATLQAVGGSAQQIRRLLLWEAGYVGAIGAALGVVGGLWLAAVLVWVINKQSFGWTIPLLIPIAIPVIVPIGAVLASVVTAYWPASWIMRRPAADGLRYE